MGFKDSGIVDYTNSAFSHNIQSKLQLIFRVKKKLNSETKSLPHGMGMQKTMSNLQQKRYEKITLRAID
jgi:hypothetical protein